MMIVFEIWTIIMMLLFLYLIYKVIKTSYNDPMKWTNMEIIESLPDRYRFVFNLYVMDDYSHKEIAEMLGINIGTSKSNLARAKAILKDKIESNSNYSIKKTK